MSLIQYQGSDSREVLGHLTQQGSCADIPEFQRFISKHHHQVLPKEDQLIFLDQKVFPMLNLTYIKSNEYWKNWYTYAMVWLNTRY